MEFRRSGQRDNRRRRVLREDRDESEHPRDDASSSPRQRRRHRAYSRLARRRFQIRTVDLLPKRSWWLATLILGLLAVSGGIGWLEYQLAPRAAESPLAAHFLPSQPGGIDAWLGTCFWLAAAFVALQILMLRRYKADDYRGTYEVWGWLAAGCLLASLESSTQLSVACELMLTPRWPLTVAGHELAWSSALLILIGGLLGLRLAIELRGCRSALLLHTAACAVLLAVGTSGLLDGPQRLTATSVTTHGLAAASVAETSEPAAARRELGAVPVVALLLVGQTFALASLLTYARFVYLQAHGIDVQRLSRRRMVRRRARAIRHLRRQRLADARASSRSETSLEPELENHADGSVVSDREPSASESSPDRPRRRRRRGSSAGGSEAAAPAGLQVAAVTSAASAADDAVDEDAEAEGASGDESDSKRTRKSRKRGRNMATPDAAPSPGPESPSAEPPGESDERETSADDMDGPDTLSMSKAERRRQRKATRRAQRRAA